MFVHHLDVFLFLAGLRPGLLAKYQAATTSEQKFEFLKAFMVDSTNLGSLTIESHYVETDTRKSKSKWVEKPLWELRKLYDTPELKRFLQTKILDRQAGRNHPQDPTGEDESMKLYWVYQESSDTQGHAKEIGTTTRGVVEVQQNKAARTAVADVLVGNAADFGKGFKGGAVEQGNPGKGKGKNGKGKGKDKGKKVGSHVNHHFFEQQYISTPSPH